jgi:hypothetical protein
MAVFLQRTLAGTVRSSTPAQVAQVRAAYHASLPTPGGLALGHNFGPQLVRAGAGTGISFDGWHEPHPVLPGAKVWRATGIVTCLDGWEHLEPIARAVMLAHDPAAPADPLFAAPNSAWTLAKVDGVIARAAQLSARERRDVLGHLREWLRDRARADDSDPDVIDLVAELRKSTIDDVSVRSLVYRLRARVEAVALVEPPPKVRA